MAENLYYNSKYYILRPDKRPDSWLASFNAFKSIRQVPVKLYDERPPYPVLISNPTLSQCLANVNKSDVLVYFSFLSAGFIISMGYTRHFYILKQKLWYLHIFMHCFNVVGLFWAVQCSSYRLTGMMDNGLRWKRKDRALQKWDVTKDFEEHTIFKHFRERPES